MITKMTIQREDEITITVQDDNRLYRRHKTNGEWESLCSWGWEKLLPSSWKAGILEYKFNEMEKEK